MRRLLPLAILLLAGPGRVSARYIAEARVHGAGASAVREIVEEHGRELARRFWVPRDPKGPLAFDFLLGPARLGRVERGAVALETPDGPQRWSPAIWVDAAGRRTGIPWEGDEAALHLRLDEALLAASAYPAMLDPQVGPLIDVAPAPVVTTAGTVSAVWHGGGWFGLVAPQTLWRPQGITVFDISPDLGARRKLADLAGSPITRVMLAGPDAMLLRRADGTGWASWVSPDGGTVSIPTVSGFGTSVVAAAGAATAVEVYFDNSPDGGSVIRSSLMSRAGAAAARDLVDAQPSPLDVAAVTGGFQVGLLSQPNTSSAQLQVWRLDNDGGVTGPTTTTVSSWTRVRAQAVTGGVAWLGGADDFVTTITTTVLLVTTLDDGSLGASERPVFVVRPAAAPVTTPVGSGALVAAYPPGAMPAFMAALVDVSGGVTVLPTPLLPDAGYYVQDIAFGAGSVFVQAGLDTVSLQGLVSFDGGPATALLPSVVIPSYAAQPGVACSGDQCLIVWSDTRPLPGVLPPATWAARVSADGTVLGPAFPLAPGTPGNVFYPPENLVASGDGFEALLIPNYQFIHVRVGVDGGTSALDTIFSLGAVTAERAQLCSRGSDSVAVWLNNDFGNASVQYLRWAPDGARIDAAPQTLVGTQPLGMQDSPFGLGADDVGYRALVVHTTSVGFTSLTLYTLPEVDGGAGLPPVDFSAVEPDPAAWLCASVLCAGHECVVTTGTRDAGVTRLWSPDGGLRASVGVTPCSVKSDGVRLFGQPQDTAAITLQQFDTHGVLVGAPFTLALPRGDPDTVALTSAADAGTLFVTAGPNGDAGYGIRAELVRTLGLGMACNAPTDCGSGDCVDGVCCDAACGGGLPGDCLACSIAQGAAVDGTCATLSGTVCRPATAACDVEEVCDGVAPSCPPDVTTCAPDAGGVDGGNERPQVKLWAGCGCGEAPGELWFGLLALMRDDHVVPSHPAAMIASGKTTAPQSQCQMYSDFDPGE